MIATCLNCGDSFNRVARPGKTTPGRQRHCSESCLSEFRAKWLADHRQAKREANVKSLSCWTCEKPFYHAYGSTRYCSAKCKNAPRLAARKAANLKPCVVCDTPTTNPTCCSDKCRAARMIAQRKTPANRIYNSIYYHTHKSDPAFRAKSKARFDKWKATNGDQMAWQQANSYRAARGRAEISFDDWKRLRMIRAAKRALKLAKPDVFKAFYGVDRNKDIYHRRYFTDSEFRKRTLEKSARTYQKVRKPKLQLLWGAYRFFRSINVLPPIQGGNQKAQAARLALTEAAKAGITLPPELAALIPQGSVGVQHAA